ncbi:UDP-N-acetylglucosamine 2-epimerase (non-hydrolyzing) [Iocasia frigidifontis]|uniref:UDP-N-acetylglucosamine 2-epimerase (Non-hydrolyzing) n=1 Tax=Iocasia fonsfrigidae TaxID=2682810 RepID=A0A8A7K911_9FIRM|nr:UDP-N-acetylglucosamine 2-epimerase (non-hydrolyzing) [Iocasia fonsfrigidae]QTL97690.1 UDP-N-acetylglucosamine 2-epimerase (non-hydrolyzing) [Iocasia fonsfrigidae]
MKVMTILGTRPEIIRLSLIISKLDKLCEHLLVHTGQNYSTSLNNIFFQLLEIRKPDYYLNIKEKTFGKQLGRILCEIEEILNIERPDKVLILGDTNSGLAAIAAVKSGIPVFHLEAGNRCFDSKVPEENNRKVIDSIATYNLPYTPGSRENLLLTGIEKKKIFLSGNPIYEVLTYYKNQIKNSSILQDLKLEKNNYILVTIHRSENVDIKDRLEIIIKAINKIQNQLDFRMIFSVHPRTKDKLKKFKLLIQNSDIFYSKPFGFFDFVKLEKNAALVLTDSGTVQEECCIFKVPTVTVRDTTERPETVECGSNIVSGINYERIIKCAELMYNSNRNWSYPEGYIDKNVSDKVIAFLLSKK